MTTTLELLKGKRISLEEALQADSNLIPDLSYKAKRDDIYDYLIQHRVQIIELVSRHLGISQSNVTLTEHAYWLCGTFNICLPIDIDKPLNRNLPGAVILRFPLPFKVGELFHPGNINEKLRCEAATYIWLHRNCPSVPIPRLLGFGFPGTLSFTALENESLWNRITWYFRRTMAWFTKEVLPPFFAHHRRTFTDNGYLIIEDVIDQGDMLSRTWEKHRHDSGKRANLFRGLAQTMLCLAKIELPRIGSWTMDDRGILSLTNRPLWLNLHFFENQQIPTDIPRNLTYTSIEPYVLDMLACQDNRLRAQPNAIHNERDGKIQLSALAGLRAVLPKLLDRRSHGGPFTLMLTDLHQSNIFVDEDWNIKRIIDLEWACVLPIQMLDVPYWLTGRGIDQLKGDDLKEFERSYHHFVDALETEETTNQQPNMCSQVLRDAWTTGRYWYTQAVHSQNAFSQLFEHHILPRFGKFTEESSCEVLAPLWAEDAADFIASKVADQERYDNQVRQLFAVPATQKD